MSVEVETMQMQVVFLSDNAASRRFVAQPNSALAR